METLSEHDAARLQRAHAKWADVLARQDYRQADRFRKALKGLGCMGAKLDKWHPTFESTVCRQAQLKGRMWNTE